MRTAPAAICAALTLTIFSACEEQAPAPAAGAPVAPATAAAQPTTPVVPPTGQPVPSLPDNATQPAATTAWPEPGGHFTVGFPAEPTLTEKEMATPAGTIKMKMYVVPKGEARLGVNFGPLSLPKGQVLDVKKSLEKSRDHALTSISASKKDEKDIEVNGIAGKELSFLVAIQGVEARGIMRLFIRKDPAIYYQATAIAPTAVDEAELRTFIDSFQPAQAVGGIDAMMANTGAAVHADDVAPATGLPASGKYKIRFADVTTKGPAACVFFAGPLNKGSKRSYAQDMGGVWKLSGSKASLSFGGLVDFSGKVKDGKVTLVHAEKASLTGSQYTFTEKLSGKFDSAGVFKAIYTYSDCKVGGGEPCPGPCRLEADMRAYPN